MGGTRDNPPVCSCCCGAEVQDTERFTSYCSRPAGHDGKHRDADGWSLTPPEVEA